MDLEAGLKEIEIEPLLEENEEEITEEELEAIRTENEKSLQRDRVIFCSYYI